ncbi:MAG: hypothetical protein COA67_04990 [Lutibacter sp.]|nr:MAG: hypothetical protein COA67_04990 [Lutibacter sp.]
MGILVVFILFMIGILFFIYWIPKKLGYPKVGKYLSIILSIFLVLIVLFWVFQDSFFTKDQARSLLAEQDIVLKDDFKILNNNTRLPIADYYHRFRLEISDNDKSKIIEKIKKSDGFKRIDEEKKDLIPNTSDYNSTKIIQNYEDSEMFVIEHFRPNHEGGASIYKRIELEKSENTLVFIEMQE